MPLSLAAKAALSSSAAQAGGGALNALFGWIGQRRQRNYEKEMYEKMKRDEIEFWNMENLYNTPEAQMKRFKDAGLNPNLIYGQFNNQTPNLNLSPATISDQGKFLNESGKQITESMGGMIPLMYNLRQQDAQTDLTYRKIMTEEAQSNYLATVSGLKELEQIAQQQKNIIGKSTMQSVIRQATLAVEKSLADIQNTMQNTRVQQQQEKFTGQQTKTAKSQEELNKSQRVLNELEQDLINMGYSKNDTALQRILKMVKNIIFFTD